jgi:ABC-type lipoprotein release transport system permease subunit
MTFTRLLLRNLCFHWRASAAVLCAVAVGCAVLTGALLVGDSLRGSLEAQALEQLGWVDQSLVASRFFREELANNLPANQVAPAILVQGSAASTGAVIHRAGNVTVLAVDERFWPKEQTPVDSLFWSGEKAGVVLNQTLATRLDVKVGERITLYLQSADRVPRETLIGKRKNEDVLSRLSITVRAILPDHGLGRFALRPGPAPPLNAFVPLKVLQERRDSEGKAPLFGRVNVLLAGGAQGSLSAALRERLTLDDWNLELTTPEQRARELFKLLAGDEYHRPDRRDTLRRFRWQGRIPEELAAQPDAGGWLALADLIDFYNRQHGYLNLTTPRVFIEPGIARAVTDAAGAMHWPAAPTLAYMVDTISDGKAEMAYAIVAAIDPMLQPPLGPFGTGLTDGKILLADWKGRLVQASPGQPLTLLYDIPDAAGQLQKKRTQLVCAGSIAMEGAADDPDLTPRFEGITDRLSIRDWSTDLPFTVDQKRLKLADNLFWDRYRATPKAYVTLKTGQQLWGSRFGDVTSVRLAPATAPTRSEEFAQAARDFRRKLLDSLSPETGGLVFQNVRDQALAAGQGSSDFGGLFLGFSCFLIVAALLLVGLMFRLSLDQRGSEMGLLLAVGWRRRTVRILALAEGGVLAAVGALVGIAGAIVFTDLLLRYLGVLWPGGLEHSLLQVHVSFASLAIGYGGALLASVLTIFLATRMLKYVPPRSLLSGQTVSAEPTGPTHKPRLSAGIAIAALVGIVPCLVFGALATDHEAEAGSFFTAGLLALTALLAGLWWWMARFGHGHGSTMPGIGRLSIRNAARHRVRSVLTVGLLASAAFMIVAVQAFHRDPARNFLEETGGSGGYAWVGESTVPIFQDLNSKTGRTELRLSGDALRDVTFVPFRVQPGDDASCLNLYQPLQPRILGVPPSLIARGGFQFAASEADASNPWQLLQQPRGDGAIPAIGEANTVKWILKSGLGQEVIIKDGRGQPVRLRIVAMLEDSVFQSELLIAEDAFLKLFPRQEGFRFVLVQAPPPPAGNLTRQAVETALADYGFALTPSAERLQSYLDVENTYLATFQSLGGLGLLLGTLGLAVVLVRSVWERRGELALLRAVGLRRSALGWLVMAENAWLLVLGLAFGCVAAVVAMAPFVLRQAGEILQPQLLLLLAAVAAVGLMCGAIAVWTTLRVPLLPALRRE